MKDAPDRRHRVDRRLVLGAALAALAAALGGGGLMVLWPCSYADCAAINVTDRHLPRRCERCGRLTLTPAEEREMEER